MKRRYLEVTFRSGRPFAAYLYLPRLGGERATRTQVVGPGLLVDYSADGRPIGLEITDPAHVTLAAINAILEGLGVDAADPQELSPLRAA